MEPSIAIEIVNDQLVVHFIDSYSHRLQNFEPVWRQIAKDLMELEEQIFATQGSVIGRPWVPLSPKTIRQKQRKGFPLEPLVRTGRLRASLTEEGSGEMILDIEPLSIPQWFDCYPLRSRRQLTLQNWVIFGKNRHHDSILFSRCSKRLGSTANLAFLRNVVNKTRGCRQV